MKNAFRLGHNYDVTEYYKKLRGQYADYTKYYICDDVWDFHVYRILEGYNMEYDEEPRTKLIEQGDIDKNRVLEEVESRLEIDLCVESIRSFPSKYVFGGEMEDGLFKTIVESIVYLDDGDNFDLREYRFDTPIEELIDDIDAGYGITVLDADLNEVENE